MKALIHSGVAVFLIMVALLAACDDDTATGTTGTLPFESFEEARFFHKIDPAAILIGDEPLWDSLWQRHWNSFDSSGQRTNRPFVDFDEDMLLAVFWGQRPSGCDSWVPGKIREVRIELGNILVEVDTLLNADLGSCDAVVYPYEIIKLKRIGLPISFVGQIPRKEE